jgi:hypothetical protein
LRRLFFVCRSGIAGALAVGLSRAGSLKYTRVA